MNMQQIRELAKEKGAKIGRMSKVDAIRMIQLTEGNYDCYARGQADTCGQDGCFFRQDCVQIAQSN